MLEAIITSKTRINLLLKFFLNSNTRAWLRSLESEFGESTNAIRLELNRLEKAGLLITEMDGNKKVYKANINHPLYQDIHNALLKHIGIDEIISRVNNKLGKLDAVYLTGEYAKGRKSKLIDLWFVGQEIDKKYLLYLIEKSEKMINRRIRYIILSKEELQEFRRDKSKDELLLIWRN
jgi:DNA-binding transcriptional ArsR family regulator